MSSLCYQLLRSHTRRLIRNCQPVRHKAGKGAYEGDGKTTMTILNRDADHALMIDKITTEGFKLNIGVNIFGPMIIFPRSVIGWNIGSTTEIHEDSMALFKILEPKPDILILGLDKDYPRRTKFIEIFKKVVYDLNIKCEILSVDKACTTFNFLNDERRYAVAALLPPESIEFDVTTFHETAVRRMMQEPVSGIFSKPNDPPKLEKTSEQISPSKWQDTVDKDPLFSRSRTKRTNDEDER